MRIFKPTPSQSSPMDEELERLRAKRMEEIKQRIMTPPSAHEGILIVTQENFSRIIRENPNLIIDFWAPWCGPCRMLAPVIEQLAAEYAGRIRFAKCNTDENQQIAYQFGISAIPSLFFFQNGTIIHTVSGALPKEHLEMQIRSVYTIQAPHRSD
ncbi:thioredoxin [Methanospirillum hungatei JF-1]|jgi:thioredoxin 1|uniref:Thioredoxin n=2 Tax=Methanospirillum hungatei TaxID=2203 RepID=Q2FU47_METHJ|nr:thioredoxin [Methanospirillum hungatei JF-1]